MSKGSSYKNYAYSINKDDGSFRLTYRDGSIIKTIKGNTEEDVLSRFQEKIDSIEAFKIDSPRQLTDDELKSYKKRVADNIRMIKNQLDRCHYLKADGQLIRINELYHHADIIKEAFLSRGWDYRLELEKINNYNGGYFYILWDNNYPFTQNVQQDIADELNK